ncbi:nucleoside triphosphate pyrophosphohydrolase family protein [Mesosutterella sp. AGMB02718]|uniref:Nucleoside triphosphate pyrophosphohydrolase family protein n=1 Tax=Mesosutterella faecium TaxID=2925194 RepID=A0ABT7IST0_9BURK|nr:nucleoside triphosphate pyrophosphohydrolase family protein [Mesosutterella sp. AGMB02718]MDL2060332.1 nucleoside triphosphate pyrophosphohydrolase family protein [Mesosutterella sp. AGMB02718]MDL2060555.1 nucleoside triphosphate pyrophosphohydrolase family protein [Mesosutterella sp. AGMB02718]
MEITYDKYDANVYQSDAARTINPELTRDEMAQHATLGMVSEIGEICGIYQKTFQGHEPDPEHAKRELGDLLWFVAEYCTAQGWKLSDVMRLNISKLRARYPQGFDPERSRHRAQGDV